MTRVFRRRDLLALAGAVLLLGPAPVAAAPLFPALRDVRYRVLRDGRAIGEHRVAFRRPGGRLQVATEIDLAVQLLFVTVFRFRHRAREVWDEAGLLALDSETDDDGTAWRLAAARDGDRLRRRVNGDERPTLPAATLPSSLWHPGTLTASRLLDVIDGGDKAVRVAAVGQEAVDTPEGPRPAARYAMTGEIARDLWVAPDGNLLRVAFPARDGSRIELQPV